MLPSPTDSREPAASAPPVYHGRKVQFPLPLMGANWRGEFFTIKGIFGFECGISAFGSTIQNSCSVPRANFLYRHTRCVPYRPFSHGAKLHRSKVLLPPTQ